MTARIQEMGMRKSTSASRPSGFTLLETMVAVAIVFIALIALAGVLAASIAYENGAQADFLAQQKAAEGIESIFTARDMQAVTFAQIQNVSSGGIFLNGPENLMDPGLDGIVDTADDNPALPDTIIKPGPSGILGAADDIQIQLSVYYKMQRTITISNIAGETGVRMITCTVTYKSGMFTKTYTLTSYISQYA
jgi:type II secretory pathway pseudopilin PulG